VNAILVELNQYSINLQDKLGVTRWFKVDFTTSKLPFKHKYNFITSIEVFEHIEDIKLLPFIATLANHCEYFLFSSTPHKDMPEFDEQWGHVNIKPTDEWIRLFELNGFELLKEETKYLQENCIPTTWTLIFKSLKHA